MTALLDFKQLGLFGFGDAVDLDDIAVGHLLQPVLGTLQIVFGDFAFLD